MVKNLMTKKRETGGMVVLNLWWDYTLCRIVNLSHDESVVRENLDNYTAVMLFRELCGLITKGMGEVVKSGSHVDYIKDQYGVDWVSNAWNTAKVIDRCGGESHILNADVIEVQRHLAKLMPGAELPWGRSPSKMCVICMSKPVRTVMIPCG